MILLTWEKPLNPVEVELLFPSSKGPGTGTVTCRTTSNQVRTAEPHIIVDILFSESSEHICRCMWSPRITQPAPLTVECHFAWLRIQQDITSLWQVTAAMPLWTQRLSTWVSVCGARRFSPDGEQTSLSINYCTDNTVSHLLSDPSRSLQFQSPCHLFMCTARWRLLSCHGNLMGSGVSPRWVYVTLTRRLSHTSILAHRRSGPSTQWEASTLERASESKLWWRQSSKTLI